MTTATQLSKTDLAILGALFDPEASLTRPSTTVLPAAPPSKPGIEPAARASEQSAILLTDSANPSDHNVQEALAQLNAIVAAYPTYASAYVNRAQANRFLFNSTSDAQILKSILEDLDKAIALATPENRLTTQISADDAHVLAAAHTHRGYIFLHASANEAFRQTLLAVVRSLAALSGLSEQASVAQLEEQASLDLSFAGRYGNKAAGQVAVKTNPYAKLCGQIVREALQREIKEFYGGVGVVGV